MAAGCYYNTLQMTDFYKWKCRPIYYIHSIVLRQTKLICSVFVMWSLPVFCFSTRTTSSRCVDGFKSCECGWVSGCWWFILSQSSTLKFCLRVQCQHVPSLKQSVMPHIPDKYPHSGPFSEVQNKCSRTGRYQFMSILNILKIYAEKR